MSMTRTLGTVVGALALGCSVMVINPGAAVAGGPQVVSDSYKDQTVECGYPIDISGTFTSAAMDPNRSPQNPTTFFHHERFSFREVWTNTATGAWFVIRGESVWADLSAKQVDGNVYE